MSNIMQTAAGRLAMRHAAIDVIRMRMRRWFERNTVIAFNDYLIDGELDYATIVGELNVAHDTEIYQLNDLLNWLLAGEATTQDRTFYVDPSGSDETGLGTAARPFASLEFLTYSLPRLINHEIRINLAAGNYDYFPDFNLSNHIVKGDGCIILDASGATYPVVEGTYTINTITAHTGLVGGFTAIANNINPVAGPGWIPDEHAGNFVHFRTGACAGQCYAIIHNTATDLRIGVDWFGAAPGDTFDIVTCPAVFNLTEKIIINGLSASMWNSGWAGIQGKPYAPETSYINMAGIEFSFATDVQTCMLCTDINLFMTFCKISGNYPDEYSCALRAKNCHINNNDVQASTFANNALSDWYCSYLYIQARGGTFDYDDHYYTRFIDCNIFGIVLDHKAFFQELGFFHLYCTGWENVRYSLGAMSYVEGDGVNDAVNFINSRTRHTSIAFYNVNTPIYLSSSDIRFYWLQGAAIAGNYAVELGTGICSMCITGLADVTMVGVLGAYYYLHNATGHANYPAIGTSTNDTAASVTFTNS